MVNLSLGEVNNAFDVYTTLGDRPLKCCPFTTEDTETQGGWVFIKDYLSCQVIALRSEVSLRWLICRKGKGGHSSAFPSSPRWPWSQILPLFTGSHGSSNLYGPWTGKWKKPQYLSWCHPTPGIDTQIQETQLTWGCWALVLALGSPQAQDPWSGTEVVSCIHWRRWGGEIFLGLEPACPCAWRWDQVGRVQQTAGPRTWVDKDSRAFPGVAAWGAGWFYAVQDETVVWHDTMMFALGESRDTVSETGSEK